jgi:hypothetical protein
MSNNRNPAEANGGASGLQSCAKQIAPEDSPRPGGAQAPARRPLANVEYLLAEIRLARAHASLWVNTLDTIGTALKAGLITPEMAVAELRECGFFHPLVDRPIVAEVGQ